ncbi:GNAT family N-acetyltransferase [Patescibacteria group bacterium]|nr:GNAT family N-acetyltransferase [Patescibacteria group bacterium]
MEIRNLQKDDVKICSEILQRTYAQEPYNVNFDSKIAFQYIEEKLRFNPEGSFAAVIDGRIIGFIFVGFFTWVEGKQGFIEDIDVDIEFQGRGYGDKLLKHAEKYIRESGAKTVMLWADKHAKALEFYKKRGFSEADELIQMFKKL